MIVYFADRLLNILGSASTWLPRGLIVSADKKTEDIETGVAVFECKIHFDQDTRDKVEKFAAVGNYILRSHGSENEFYTIIETECDTKSQTVYVYAEDAGLDLLNEVVGEYEAKEAKTINHYIETFAYDSGFRVGVNEAAGITKKLAFDDEETVTARLAKVAEAFGGFEISYSYSIKGLAIKNKFINIHQQRGQDNGVTLRLNKDIDSIVTTRSIVNLATALRCTGGTPEDAEDPISLRGYSYDDGDFYVDGDALKSRKALAKWSRYLYPDEPNQKEGHEGHIVKLFSYDTTSQKELCEKAIAELKILREIDLNFEVEIAKLPYNVKIGDRVNIVDEAGELYLSTRILLLESSVSDQEHKVTLGEHLIKTSGIHQKVAALAQQFAKNAQSAQRALSVANSAKSAAAEAKANAEGAASSAQAAQESAQAAQNAANAANESASLAQQKAAEAEQTVARVEDSVGLIGESVSNAQQAAEQAQHAAQEAEGNAATAAQDAAKAKADAADAKESLEIVQKEASTAIQKAEAAEQTAGAAKAEADNAKATAEAAKIDAQTAQKEISTLGDRLDTVTTTMEADYARKTDLTESEAHLQSQISQNAGVIASTVSMLSIIDETANNAQDQAEKAQKRAEEARVQAAQAVVDAQTAQQAADEAAQAAEQAKANADSAKAAADSAQAILDEAQSELSAAQADLETVLSRADATEDEIAAAQEAVEAAQTAANIAKQDADEATESAAEAQAQAATAQKSASEALSAANAAASYAKIAKAVASEAENASAAQARADEAAQTASAAQKTAASATKAAKDAKDAADKAAQDAAQAVADAEAADAKAVQAAADLVAAKQRLADVLADVDSTEEAIEEAQAAVDAAQIAVDKAKANATEAAAYAAQAAIDAAEAQTLADNARTVAADAQAKAAAAQTAADEAKAAADSLEIRVTQAETRITQNSEAIELRATKKEVSESIGGLKIGARNLIRNSESLTFEDYYFEGFEVAYDNEGNVSIDGGSVRGTDDGLGNVVARSELMEVSDDGNGNVQVNGDDPVGLYPMKTLALNGKTYEIVDEAARQAIQELQENGGGSGEDGFSPVAKVTQTDSGAVISVTDKSGTTMATIVNGKDGANGKDGSDGKRGTSILKVKTAPTSYTTTTAGVAPIKRMAISTIKTQSGVSEVLVGDQISYSYYLYHIYYLDSSYAYMDTYQSIRGATGAAGTNGKDGTTPLKGTDYWTEADKQEMVEDVKDSGVLMYTAQDLSIEQQTQARKNLGYVVDADHRDIFVDWYGIRRGSADYAERNSEIMAVLASTLQNGHTLHFGSGHYYFAEPIPHIEKHIVFKGVCTNASVAVEAVNYGSFLHFPNLADGEAAISIAGGVVQDLGIVGNPSVCNVTLDRTKSVTNKNGVVNLVDAGTTYGIKVGTWGFTIQNVRIRNCTYGIYTETSNALVTNVDTHQCKIGVSVGNDTKINNIQVWNVMVGVQLRGQLASATNIRGDSIGKHLIECWQGKCMLSNIDGDYCVGSLIHYGDGTKRYMHLGQAVACMGRVATRTAFSRNSSFDLRNVSNADYEYCSYISIAPYTQVFGGHIEVSNVKANIMDSASEYVHPDAPISIGTGSTVKGVTIKCNVPYDADVDYFNKQVIKSLSTNAEAENSTTEYVTDFDGKTVEDVNFITPVGFIRSKRALGALDRVLEFSKVANGAVLYDEQKLTESQKAQVRTNIGLDNISSLEFVATIDSCTDSNKTYVLPDGRTVAYAEKPSYTNQLPIAIDSTGAIYNGGIGYVDGAYISGDNYTDTTATNWDVTGYIPVKTGDIVRLKNLRFFETDVNVIPAANTKVTVKFYDKNFTWKVSSSNYSPTSLPSSAWSPVYDETGNVVQFKVPTAYSSNNIAYMRMCVRSITPDSIITVNEEIGPPKAEFGDTGLRFVTEAMYKKIEALLAQ